MRRLELVLVEHEPEMVDARRRPLARLDDDVHRALLELGQPQLETHRVELAPRDARLVRRELLADPAVTRDEVERELADVAGLDLADAARDEVVVEELHRRPWYEVVGLDMERVSGIGGVFLRARDPAVLAAWYAEHLGLDVEAWGGAVLRSAGGEIARLGALPRRHRVLRPARPAGDGELPRERPRGDARAAAGRATSPAEGPEETENGRFGWAHDPEGTASSSGSQVLGRS